ncbi:MAG: adenylate cyclase [Gammaproteobacteria bacterium]|jgi:adenylate cyclase
MEILERYKKHWVRIGLSLLILSFFSLHVQKTFTWGFVDTLESIAYDYRLRLTMPGTVDERIVIIDIDEKSLAAEGRWPWSRDRLATLVNNLFDKYEIGLLGFDIVFAEADESSGLLVLDELAKTEFKDEQFFKDKIAEIRPRLDRDQLFADSLKGRAVILGYFFNDRSAPDGSVQKTGKLPPPVFRAGQFRGRSIDFFQAEGYGGNLPFLQDNALGAGFFVTAPDQDGLVRRAPMIWEYGGAYYESLTLAMARAVLGVRQVIPGFPEESRAGTAYSGMEWLQVGNNRIPVDEHLQALVPFRGPQGSFPYISATDIINGVADVAQLKGKIALMGASAKGLVDLRATPLSAAYPGVEVHANLLAGILDGAIKENPPYTLGGEFVVLFICGLIMAFLLPVLSPLWATATTAMLLAVVVSLNMAIWIHLNLVFALASAMLMILAMFLLHMSYGYFVESRGKRQLAGLFGQYVPPELVDEMSDHPQSYSLEGESREMTVLFTDVRGFTTISEGLDPKELVQLMNGFLTPMTEVIHRHRGTIDKYMGDAIMCFWGAPINDAEHARHALVAGMNMVDTLHSLESEFKSRGWPEIRIGVGLNTGLMSVGNMGSEFRMAYTVLGDAVNLGSRLEGLTKGYGVEIIVNETTREHVPEYTYRELDRVRVKGKDIPVTIYEPIGVKKSLDSSVLDELKIYTRALRLYRGQEWDLAEMQFLNLQKQSPNRMLYHLYAERIAFYRENPPGEDWDGVFTHLEK